nr:unnamed protein product [Haemonchus contortus]
MSNGVFSLSYMTLLSGIASLLNPFAWLHRSRRTEHIERVYELQEDMVLQEDEQILPSSFPSENGEENQFTERGASDCNVKNEPGRDQIQLNIDEPNTATEALGGSNTEPTEQIDQNMEASQSDSVEKKWNAEPERPNHGESELELCTGPEGDRDGTASSFGTSESSIMGENVFVIKAPIIGIFENPTVTEIKTARKRRARNVSPGISEVMDGCGTHQPWRAKHPRRSYDLPAAGNPVVTDAQEYSHFAATPTNTPTSLRTRSKSDKSNTI